MPWEKPDYVPPRPMPDMADGKEEPADTPVRTTRDGVVYEIPSGESWPDNGTPEPIAEWKAGAEFKKWKRFVLGPEDRKAA
jgi:hypothetical protein